MDTQKSALDLLLGCDLPNMTKDLPEASFEVVRLSEIAGATVEFRLRALSYNRLEEIREGNSKNLPVHIVLGGVVSPNLKDSALMAKYGVPTPAALVTAMLLPGEVEDLSRQIEKLSGYRMLTIAEIKNDSGTAATTD